MRHSDSQKSRRATYEALVSSCDGNRLDQEWHDGLVSYYVALPLSFLIAVPFVRLEWSANAVTALRLVLSLTALGFLCAGQYGLGIVAGLLFIACFFLDFVDGCIARLNGPTPFGHLFDYYTDIGIRSLIPLAIAIGLMARPDRILSAMGDPLSAPELLAAGAVIAYLSCFKNLIILAPDYVRLHFTPSGNSVITPAGDERFSWRPLPPITFSFLYRTGAALLWLLLPVLAAFDALSLHLILIFLSRGVTVPIDLVIRLRSMTALTAAKPAQRE